MLIQIQKKSIMTKSTKNLKTDSKMFFFSISEIFVQENAKQFQNIAESRRKYYKWFFFFFERFGRFRSKFQNAFKKNKNKQSVRGTRVFRRNNFNFFNVFSNQTIDFFD